MNKLIRRHHQHFFNCGFCGYSSEILRTSFSPGAKLVIKTHDAARHGSTFQRWQRPYLKDLYHRRLLLGSDPLMSRASQDNWNYPSEISALSHRLLIPDVDKELIVQALTNRSFFERKDMNEGIASLAQPSMQESIESTSSNEQLVDRGLPIFWHITLTYLRAHWPLAPEEFIVGVAMRIASTSSLVEIANQLGLQHVVRTAEFPPSENSLHTALIALIAVMDTQRASNFVRCFVLPRLYEVPFEDVLPFRNPFSVLKDYMQKWEGISDLEVRTIGSGAVSTAMPFYEVAIYAEKKFIVGQSGGERPWVAFDLAAQDGLLRIWRVTDQPRVYPFKFEEEYATRFGKAQKLNHQLRHICGEGTNLSLYTSDELARDPIDRAEVARKYFSKIKPEVGMPHRRRLRHMFSRGTINRMTYRAFVKPKPHNI